MPIERGPWWAYGRPETTNLFVARRRAGFGLAFLCFTLAVFRLLRKTLVRRCDIASRPSSRGRSTFSRVTQTVIVAVQHELGDIGVLVPIRESHRRVVERTEGVSVRRRAATGDGDEDARMDEAKQDGLRRDGELLHRVELGQSGLRILKGAVRREDSKPNDDLGLLTSTEAYSTKP